MINKLFENEYAAFLIVSTLITTTMLLLKLRFKFLILLCKSTLISYIVFFIFTLMSIAYEHSQASEGSFQILGMILLVPGVLIQASIFGGGPCLSGNHVLFNILTFAFLFYAVLIWGIMKFIKCCKDSLAPEQKQDYNMEKQTPTETEK
jgi:hypothetical protein